MDTQNAAPAVPSVAHVTIRLDNGVEIAKSNPACSAHELFMLLFPQEPEFWHGKAEPIMDAMSQAAVYIRTMGSSFVDGKHTVRVSVTPLSASATPGLIAHPASDCHTWVNGQRVNLASRPIPCSDAYQGDAGDEQEDSPAPGQRHWRPADVAKGTEGVH